MSNNITVEQLRKNATFPKEYHNQCDITTKICIGISHYYRSNLNPMAYFATDLVYFIDNMSDLKFKIDNSVSLCEAGLTDICKKIFCLLYDKSWFGRQFTPAPLSFENVIMTFQEKPVLMVENNNRYPSRATNKYMVITLDSFVDNANNEETKLESKNLVKPPGNKYGLNLATFLIGLAILAGPLYMYRDSIFPNTVPKNEGDDSKNEVNDSKNEFNSKSEE